MKSELPDSGVGFQGSPICQNFEAHDEEIAMRSGPHDGWICPECGRATMGEVKYTDEPQ